METQVQYQHYIPQFLLRNFSHPFKPAKMSKKKGKHKKGMFKGDKVLNILDLTSSEPRIAEEPVGRWFGQDNMYSDVSKAIKSRKDVEMELSKLESRVAEILQKVKKAHEAGEPGITLNRVERNRLRKFLFIMKYRGPQFYEKYHDENPLSYDSEDKRLVWAYMIEKGFDKPRDVWLHNLRAILDLEMDAEGKWMSKLPEAMFPADAGMFQFHTQSSYLAFCTPAEENQQFVLTDQCYNIFEGPSHETRFVDTGEYLGNQYLAFHEFGPLTPRLIIVLRSCVLPEALEDTNPKIRRSRKFIHDGAAVQFPVPENVKSMLEDLPVAKCLSSYVTISNGRPQLAPGETGVYTSRDRFTFRFWPISSKHVNIINSIFLDNIHISNSIAFNSTQCFKKTLEFYMTSTEYGFKRIGVEEHRARRTRLDCLKKLSTVLKGLGSEVVPTWDNDAKNGPNSLESTDDVWLKTVCQFFENGELQPEKNHFWKLYCILGGRSNETFVKDLEQSLRLLQFQMFVCMGPIFAAKTKSLLEAGLEDEIVMGEFWLYVANPDWQRLTDEILSKPYR